MAGGRGERLQALTRRRAKPAIRFGGQYRIIDFTLSNCLNSGIRRIYMLTQFASTSLERYIRHGWAMLFHSGLGEFLETRPPQQFAGPERYEGTAHSIYMNRDVISHEGHDLTLVLSGDHVYKMDYRKLIAAHRAAGADVTIACIQMPIEEARHFGVLAVDGRHRVTAFEEKPSVPTPLPGVLQSALCNMGIYCFSTDYLLCMLAEHFAVNPQGYDFGRDVFPRQLEQGVVIYAWEFEDENRKEQPYWRDIGTLDAYYEANMDLIAVDPLFNLYDKSWPIRCFVNQLPPAKTVFNWHDTGRVGMAINSLIAPGVIISGGRVEDSILAPEVRVHSWARIERSILLDRVEVGRGAVVRNAIIDSKVIIPPGAHIGVDEQEDGRRFYISQRGIRLVSDFG